MAEASNNSVYNIVAFVFNDKNRALEVSQQIAAAAKPAGYQIIANAVVEVDSNGKPHVHEAGQGGKGTFAGAITGGLLSLIGGPGGLLVYAIAGGVIGGLIGKHKGRAIPTEDMKQLAEGMLPDTSAILAIVRDKQTEALIDDMKGYQANIITMTLADEVSGEIDQMVAADITVPLDAPADDAGSAAPAAAPEDKPADAGSTT